MHAISSYRGNRPTNTAYPPQTGPITIHYTPLSIARSVTVYLSQKTPAVPRHLPPVKKAKLHQAALNFRSNLGPLMPRIF